MKIISKEFEIIYCCDDYTCKDCEYRLGGNLIAHHYYKYFHIILSEFLKKYNHFSPIEDKYTLLELAINYKPFWDLDNGKTLCQICHNKYPKKQYLNNNLGKKNE